MRDWTQEDGERLTFSRRERLAGRKSLRRWKAATAALAVVAAAAAMSAIANRTAPDVVVDLELEVTDAQAAFAACMDERDGLRIELTEAQDTAAHALALNEMHLDQLDAIEAEIFAHGFRTVTEAIEHGDVHHGQLLACSAALAEARSWLKWCEGGFRRPEEGP